MVDQGAHQRLALLHCPGVRVVIDGHVDQRLPRQFYAALLAAFTRRQRPALGHITITRSRFNWIAAGHLAIKHQAITQLAQQHAFETAQHCGMVLCSWQLPQRSGIGLEQLLVGILPRQQFQQQFIEVKPADQAQAAQRRITTLPFGLVQRFEFGLAGPAEQQRLKRHQHPAQC